MYFAQSLNFTRHAGRCNRSGQFVCTAPLSLSDVGPGVGGEVSALRTRWGDALVRRRGQSGGGVGRGPEGPRKESKGCLHWTLARAGRGTFKVHTLSGSKFI